MAAAKKRTTKKVAKKSSSKKSTAKKSTAKKSTAKKAIAKKRTVKRTTKKAAPKKRTVKKTSAKKRVAKKSTAKRTTAKRTTSRRTTSKKRVVKKSSARKNAPITLRSLGITEEDVRQLQDRTRDLPKKAAPAERSETKSGGLRLWVLIFIVAGALAIAFSISHSKSTEVTAEDPTPVESVEPTPMPTPTPTPSETVKEVVAPKSFSLRSSFTSLGADISWSAPAGAKSLELKISASERSEAHLITLAGSARAYSAEKSDTVGRTSFILTATMADGSEIASKPLYLDGQY